MKEYDLDNADTAATNDLADRCAFVLDSEAWVELQDLLDQTGPRFLVHLL